MQIAKLFAGLGFQVDTTGLAKFKAAVASARSEITSISRGAKTATNQFRGLRRETDKLSASMNKIKNAGGNRQVGGSYRQLAADVWKVKNALDSIATNQTKTTRAIGKINASVVAGLRHWTAYRTSIVQARRALHNLNGDLARLRANSDIRVRIRNTGGNGGGGNGGGGRGGSRPVSSAFGTFGAGYGMRGFLANILPSMALGGGGAMLGYGGKAMVESARDQTRMESMVLMTSKSTEEFSRTMDYVTSEAARLGLSSTELGKSFAQISMSAGGMSQGAKENMFTGFSEFMMSMGTSQADQKGIFRAFNQMFSNNRILQEEINQLSERGIPATLIYDAAMKAYDTDNIQQIKKLQEDGKLDPKRVLPVMAKMVQDLAHDSGAYAKMMESSIVKQGKMYEQLRQTSKEIMDSGLDVWLGKVFGQLEALTVGLGNVARSIEYIVKSLSDLKMGLDGVSSDNGGALIVILSLLIFRFKGLRLGVKRASIVLRSSGKITRALGELMKGVLGKNLKMLITRFGGWITVIYAAYKALSFLGQQLKQRDLGNWTIFDTIGVMTDVAVLKVKTLVAELQWLKAFITSGAMMDSSLEDMTSAAKKRAKKEFDDFTLPLVGKAFGGAIYSYNNYRKARDKILGREEEVKSANTPFLNKSSYKDANSHVYTFNLDMNGKTVDQIKVPVTYNK